MEQRFDLSVTFYESGFLLYYYYDKYCGHGGNVRMNQRDILLPKSIKAVDQKLKGVCK